MTVMRRILLLTNVLLAGSAVPHFAHAATKTAPGAFDTAQHVGVIGETHDLSLLIGALKKNRLKKDEFETSEQYQARLAEIRLPGVLPLDATIAVKFRTDQIAPFCENRYNADTRELAVGCDFTLPRVFLRPVEFAGLSAYTIGMASSKDTGTYTGTNAFGVKAKITKRVASGQGLAISNFETATTEREKIFRKLELTLPAILPEQARSLVQNLGVVFIAQPISPFLVSYSVNDTPSLTSPIDFKGNYDYLYVRLQQMWLVDLKSNRILRRFDSNRNVLSDQ